MEIDGPDKSDLIDETCFNLKDPQIIDRIADSFSAMDWKYRNNFLVSILKHCRRSDLAFLHSYMANAAQHHIDFIEELPEEISIHILSYLPGKDCVNAALVSRCWNRIIRDNDLWRRICVSQLPSARQVGKELELAGRSWKKFFVKDYLTDSNWEQGRYSVSPVKVPSSPPTQNQTSLCLSFDDRLENALNIYPNNAESQGGQLWSLSNGTTQFGLIGHNGNISAVKMSSKYIISGGVDRLIKVWSAETGECLHTLTGHEGEIESLQFLGDVLVSGSQDRSIRIWSISGGICLGVLKGHTDSVTCVQLDTLQVASGSTDSTIRIWDMSTQRCVKILRGHESHVLCLQLDPNHIISGSADETVKIWDRAKGNVTRNLVGHRSSVVCLQSDGRKIVSGGADKSIRVWSFSTGQCLYVLNRHSGPIWNIRFDRSRLFSTSFDQTVLCWDFDGFSCLSEEERQRWIEDV